MLGVNGIWREFLVVHERQLIKECENCLRITIKVIIRGNEWLAAGEKKEATIAELTSWILEYVEQNTAGSPTDETIKWTHLRRCDIVLHLPETYQVEVGTDCVKRILYAEGYRKRKPAKTKATQLWLIKSRLLKDADFYLITSKPFIYDCRISGIKIEPSACW